MKFSVKSISLALQGHLDAQFGQMIDGSNRRAKPHAGAAWVYDDVRNHIEVRKGEIVTGFILSDQCLGIDIEPVPVDASEVVWTTPKVEAPPAPAPKVVEPQPDAPTAPPKPPDTKRKDRR